MEKTGYKCFTTDKPRRTGYTRLSKDEIQGRDTLGRHFEQLRLAGATEVYWDIISRRSKKRVGLQKVMKLIEEHQTNEIILIRIDRLTCLHTLMEDFIELVCKHDMPCRGIEDAIDLSTIGGRMHAQILVALSAANLGRITEKSKAAWEHFRRREKAIHPPRGYVINSQGRHQIDTRPFLCLLNSREIKSLGDISREIIETFLEVKGPGRTAALIHRKYGIQKFNFDEQSGGVRYSYGLVLSQRGLTDWITNPVLRGHLRYRKPEELIIHHTHPDQRLISEKEWREIQIIQEENKKTRGLGLIKTPRPLSGLVKCSVCYGNCEAISAGKRNGRYRNYYYYKCSNSKYGACSNKKLVRFEKIEQALIDLFVKNARKIAQNEVAYNAQVISPKIQELTAQVEKLHNAGDNYAIQVAIETIEKQIAFEKNKLLEESKSHVIDIELLIEVFSDPEAWDAMSGDRALKRKIFHQLCKKVFVNDGEVVSVVLKI